MASLVHPDAWLPAGIESLEPAAWEVLRSQSHYSVIAGPGAGKTELLAQRAIYLLQTGFCPEPRRILALSYKRDAAKNIKARVLDRCSTNQPVRFDSFTFDAFAKNLLDHFRRGLPDPWKPTADWLIVEPLQARNVSTFYQDASKKADIAGLSLHGSEPSTATFFNDTVVGHSLQTFDTTSFSGYAAHEYWEQSLHGVDGRSRLSFPMIERLVELLLRENPLILLAVRATYAYVFLDEFQDTTGPQYDLAKILFMGSGTKVTAVGDNKQRIMVWAGALPNIFELFESDFAATRRALISNYRSSPKLVEIQHTLAWAIDEGYVPADSKVKSTHGDEPCLIYEFANPEQEAAYLAESIYALLKDGGLRPRDIAVLVRQRPGDYEALLAEALASYGIQIRVEAQLQDLLAERLTQVLLPFLRLASVARSSTHWSACYDLSNQLRGIDWEADETQDDISPALQSLNRSLKDSMGNMPSDATDVRQMVDLVLEFLGIENLTANYQEYKDVTFLAEVLEQLCEYLFTSCSESQSWTDALDRFEGINSIPLMSIHKSKGLEYDTVVFLGLDDKAWWSYVRDPIEGNSTFFVAFSRAKQRVWFTYCASRGGKADVATLYDLLHSANVPSVQPFS